MLKKLLITGGAGFIGSAFVRRALDAGCAVTVLDKLTYAGKRENLEGLDVKLVVGDICDAPLVASLLAEKPDALVHIAAETHVDNSIAAPDDFIRTNILGSYTLLTEARNAGIQRIVQVSTDEVFGSLLPEDPAFTETSPYQPNSPYAASKAAADHLARAWHHTYGLPVIVTHCSNNYGPRQYPEKLIPLAIARMLSGEPIPIYGDGLQVRDWIHVEDHAEGIWLALTKGQVGENYAFGGRAEYTNLALMQMLCGLMDEAAPRADGKNHASAITFVTDRLGHDRRYAIDDRKAEQELGFARRYGLFEGLKALVQWTIQEGSQ
jgi:dTDP-glucose 4,6-dehydratase